MLIVIVNQRSLDVEKHFVTDTMIAKGFADKICEEFNIKLRYVKFQVSSFHIYKKDEEILA